MPFQLKKVLELIKAGATKWALIFFVLVLLGVNMFLREDELSEVCVEDILTEHSSSQGIPGK